MAWSRDPGRRSSSATTALRRRIMQEHQGICHACGHDGANEIDHLVNVATWIREQRPGDYNDPSNLAPIHGIPCPTCGIKCHNVKTQQEARHTPRRRTEERHPGILW